MFKVVKNFFSKKYEKKVLTHPAVQKAFAEQEFEQYIKNLNKPNSKTRHIISNQVQYEDMALATQRTVIHLKDDDLRPKYPYIFPNLDE